MKKIIFSAVIILSLLGCSKIKIDTIYSKEHNFYAKFPAGYNFKEYQKTTFKGNMYTEAIWSAVVNCCEYTLTVTKWQQDLNNEINQLITEDFDQIMLSEYGGTISLDEYKYSNNHQWRQMIISNYEGIKNSEYTTLWVKYAVRNNKHFTLLIFTTDALSFDNYLVWNSIHFIEEN